VEEMATYARHWRALFGWLLLVYLPAQADGLQVPRLRIIGAESGLPSTEIAALEQGRAGDVWIASKDGLARYDGIEMTVWRHDPNDPASLPENRLQVLHIGSDGRIWIGGISQGAAVLDPVSGTLTRYGADQFALMRSNSIFAIATSDDAVWLATLDGLYKIAAEGEPQGWWHEADAPDSLPGRAVLDLAFDPEGVLWLGTNSGLACIGQDGVLRRVSLPGPVPSPLISSVTFAGGRLWVGTDHGVVARQEDGGWEWPEWSVMFARPNVMFDLAVDVAGDLWLASQRGVWRVPTQGEPVPVRPTVNPVGMPVYDLLLQSDGALWVPVYGQGLGYLRSDWRRVAQFTRGSFDLGGDHYQAITPARDGGHWLLARNGAVERMDGRGVVERLDARLMRQIKGEHLIALAEDERGALWMVGQNRVIRAHRNGRIERWQRDDVRDAALPGPNMRVIVAADGLVWIHNGTAGIQVRDAHTGAVLGGFGVAEHARLGFHPGDVEQMEVGPDGALWVAGVDGLVRFDFRRGVEGEAALRGTRVLVFGFDGARVLWLFRSHQLERFELHGGRWEWRESIGADEGLPVIDPGGLRVDAQHRVWMSTSRGLYYWDPSARRVQYMGVQHGLQSQEFIERVLALDADGMLVGTTIDGGVVMIDTQAPDPPAFTPRLNLRPIAVRRAGQWQELAHGTALALAHDEREFRISMRLPYYDAPQSHRYWSQLEGYDQGWIAQGDQGDRIFSGIPPGHYTLHLRASDANGNPSAVHTLELHLQPPWWLSPGFRGNICHIVISCQHM